MSILTLQVRTRDNLLDLLSRGESGDWVVSQEKEREIGNVEIVDFSGQQMIRARFDSESSYRLAEDNRRLVIRFADAKIVNCDVSFDSQNPVRYLPAS